MDKQFRVEKLLSMYEDEGVTILKSLDNLEISKGRKGEPLGMKKKWGDKDYIKTVDGWKPVGKESGAAKQAHDYVHGEKPYNKEESGAKFADHLKGMVADVSKHMDKFLADEKITIKDYENASPEEKEKLNKKWRASEHYANANKPDTTHQAYANKPVKPNPNLEEDENGVIDVTGNESEKIPKEEKTKEDSHSYGSEAKDWWHKTLSINEQKAFAKKHLLSFEYNALVGNTSQYASKGHWDKLINKVWEGEKKGEQKVEKSLTPAEFQKAQAARILSCFSNVEEKEIA